MLTLEQIDLVCQHVEAGEQLTAATLRALVAEIRRLQRVEEKARAYVAAMRQFNTGPVESNGRNYSAICEAMDALAATLEEKP